MSDLSAIYDRIRREPHHEAHWLALANELRDSGHDDLAVVVRGYYPLLGEAVASGKSPDESIGFFTPEGIQHFAKQLRRAPRRKPSNRRRD
jgi:hypothetical protein